MDYEKKYNDALNLAKSYYGNGSNEFLDTIFPELRESDDERIRKYLLGMFPDPDDSWDGISARDIIAYLEKQKESLHDSEICKENADSFTDENEIHGKWILEYLYDGLRKADEQFKDQFKAAIAYLEKQKELKEIPLMNGDADLYFDDWNQQKQNPTKRQCFEEGIRYAQRLQKEQKQGWSEEDEKTLDMCKK